MSDHADALAEVAREVHLMLGHQHWDHTMQSGPGCEKCIANSKIAGKVRDALARYDATKAVRDAERDALRERLEKVAYALDALRHEHEPQWRVAIHNLAALARDNRAPDAGEETKA